MGFEEGARHRCAMVGGKDPVCQCCTCMSEVKPIRDGFVDLGREAHPVLDGASYTTIEGVASFDECVAKCGRDCKWGSFIARKNTRLNSCVVASTDAAKTATGKLRTAQCPGKGEKCHSFLHPGLSDKAVDLGNSKAFIRKGDADIANPADRKSKHDFVKCVWSRRNRKCVATSGGPKAIPKLTDEYKTIPGAREKWCKAHQASHHNMEWVAASKECHYGCNAIHSEKECIGAEDHFKIKDGARPCRLGKNGTPQAKRAFSANRTSTNGIQNTSSTAATSAPTPTASLSLRMLTKPVSDVRSIAYSRGRKVPPSISAPRGADTNVIINSEPNFTQLLECLGRHFPFLRWNSFAGARRSAACRHVMSTRMREIT